MALGLEDPSDPLPSVLEVWFTGCHSDVGGGAVLDAVRFSLADISLEWMVEQVVRSGCGIKFNDAALLKADIIVPTIQITSDNGGNTTRRRGLRVETAEQARLRQQDVQANVNDELKRKPLWWLLEFLPVKFTWQESDGTWKSRWGYVCIKFRTPTQNSDRDFSFRINVGRGREIRDPRPVFHESVRQKMEGSKYKPRAKWTPGTERYTDEL